MIRRISVETLNGKMGTVTKTVEITKKFTKFLYIQRKFRKETINVVDKNFKRSSDNFSTKRLYNEKIKNVHKSSKIVKTKLW